MFFSAHGVPKSYVEEAGDPYKEEMEECVALIMAELQRRGRANDHTLAYQSRVGPVEWLQPYTDDSIRWAAGAAVHNRVVQQYAAAAAAAPGNERMHWQSRASWHQAAVPYLLCVAAAWKLVNMQAYYLMCAVH